MNSLPQFAFSQKEATLIGFVACNGDFGLWAPRIIQKGLTFLLGELSEKVLSSTPSLLLFLYILLEFLHLLVFLLDADDGGGDDL